MPIFCVTRRQPPDANPKICVSPDANPRRQSVEYRWRWASGVGAGVEHVHFMFFVLISFGFCSQRKPSFRWNMGLTLCHTWGSNLLNPDPKSMGRVATPGGDLLGDLLDDLLTPCAGTLMIAFMIKLVTYSISWLYYIMSLVLGRKRQHVV